MNYYYYYYCNPTYMLQLHHFVAVGQAPEKKPQQHSA